MRIPTGFTLSLLLWTFGTPAYAARVSVVQFNVGNADIGCPPTGIPPVDKLRLHDPADIARIRTYLELVRPDVALFQETGGGTTQLFDPENPVLPTGYDAKCPLEGPRGNGMVCIAWRTDTASPVGLEPCQGRFIFHENGIEQGGLVRCELRLGGKDIQFVSTYVAHGSKNGDEGEKDIPRRKVLSMIWESPDLVDLSKPVLVGGDFNTEICTKLTLGDESCAVPYPASFGTLFGRHLEGYGRWNADKTFFGHYLNGKAEPIPSQRQYVCGIKIYSNNLDHLFANFGAPTPLEIALPGGKTYQCGGSSCLPGEKGFELPKQAVCRSCDHWPLLGSLEFQ